MSDKVLKGVTVGNVVSVEYQAALDRRAALVVEKQKVEASLGMRNMMIDGRRLRDHDYHQWRDGALQKKSRLDAELAELKEWLRKNNGPPHVVPKVRVVPSIRPGMLDEFDLANALVEPQHLLQRALSRLEWLCERIGMAEGDRALIDALRDYLQRHGILL